MCFRNPIPLRYQWLFPVVAGTSWFVTLAALLLTWVGKGMPRYPGQQNPYVAFISDIAACTTKPLFLTGTLITTLTYIPTLMFVHLSRYNPHMHDIHWDPRWKKVLSILSAISGAVAAVGLVLLAGLDTWRFHEEHSVLLLVCFLGLAGSMVGTTVVFWEQTWEGRRCELKGLRGYCIASAVIVFMDFCLGVSFYTLLEAEYWRVAGILEWCMAFTGAFYLWAFVGFVSVPAKDEGSDDEERRRLLQ